MPERQYKSDKAFADAYRASVDVSGIPRGKTYTILSTSVCALCSRPLYGEAHEEWHVRRHAEQLGLTYG